MIGMSSIKVDNDCQYACRYVALKSVKYYLPLVTKSVFKILVMEQKIQKLFLQKLFTIGTI